jgi:hypothetical protein
MADDHGTKRAAQEYMAAKLSEEHQQIEDLRIRCAGRNHYILVHFDSRRLLVIIKNSARPENETDTVLTVEGYRTENGRDAHLVRNNEPINLDTLILSHLRVLAGLTRTVEQ